MRRSGAGPGGTGAVDDGLVGGPGGAVGDDGHGSRSGRHPGSAREVLTVALRLGLTSFGGPVAHLGYYRAEFVQRRRWLDDAAYAEIVALGQALPGPSSSQTLMAIGHLRAGWRGALAAWVGFTLPSAVALAGLAALTVRTDVVGAGWVHALELVAVAVVLDAVLAMGRRLAGTARTAAVAAAALAAVLVVPGSASQLLVLVAAAAAGLAVFRDAGAPGSSSLPITVTRRTGVVALTAFGALLLALGWLRGVGDLGALAAVHYRAGALVFGGGHVVLPLLQEPLVPELLDGDVFLAGYGAAQAVPGPLFAIAAFVGQSVAGVPGALVALVSIFAPGVLLLFGVLPFWARVRANRPVQAALVGVNAAVVGILAAALCDPLGSGALRSPGDVAVAATLFVVLRVLGWPPWALVVVALAASPLLG